MNKMPISWVTRPFGELNKFYGANIDPANHPAERFELYSIPAFPTGKPEQPLGSEVGSTKQLVEHNDVLISKINPRINRVWQVGPPMGLRQIASSEWIGFRNPQMDARFFRYYFTGPIFRDLLCSDVTGVGGSLTRAQPKRVSGFPLPVAPVNEQKRIADKLDTVLTRVDAVSARLARVAPLLKRFRQSVLAAATSGRLTESWRISHQLPAPRPTTLGDMIKVSSGDGLTAKEMKSDGGIPVYGGNGVNGFHNEANVFEPTIVIGRVGYYCGSVHLTPSPAWVTDNALRVKFDQAFLDRSFLYYALLGTDLRSNMSSTAQPVISGQKIYPIGINIPSAAEQTEIVRRVETLFAFADRLEARLKAAQAAAGRLTPALLAKAFRGELVPQDPDDEPASELLRRLQAASGHRAPARAAGRGRKRSI